MRFRTILATAMVAALMVPALALAGGGDKAEAKQAGSDDYGMESAHADFEPALMNVSDLIGAEVDSRTGQDVGKVHELVVDPRRNGIAYAVIEYGGYLNMEGDYYAIPWNAFEIHEAPVPADSKLVLDVDRSRLERAQRYDDDWPYTADPRWIEAVHTTWYGIGETEQPDWRQEMEDLGGMVDRADMEGRRLSKLAEADVTCTRMDDLGEVENLLVDINRGHLAYVVVDVSETAQDRMQKHMQKMKTKHHEKKQPGQTEQAGMMSGEKMEKHAKKNVGMIAVPWHAVQVRGNEIFVDASPSEMMRLAYDPAERWRLEERSHAMQLHEAAHLDPYWVVTVWTPQDEQSRQAAMAGKEASGRLMAGETMTVVGELKKIARDGEICNLHVVTDAGVTYVANAGDPDDLQPIGLQAGDYVAVMGKMTDADKKHDIVARIVSKGDRSIRVHHGSPATQQMGK